LLDFYGFIEFASAAKVSVFRLTGRSFSPSKWINDFLLTLTHDSIKHPKQGVDVMITIFNIGPKSQSNDFGVYNYNASVEVG
jgi:hypothetical protein